MSFDFENIKSNDNELVNTCLLALGALKQQICIYLKNDKYTPNFAFASWENELVLKKDPNNVILSLDMLGVIYQACMHGKGMSLDYLDELKFEPIYDSYKVWNKNTIYACVFPFIPKSNFISYMNHISGQYYEAIYGDYNAMLSTNIISTTQHDANSVLFYINMPFILSYMKHIVKNIEKCNNLKFLSFAPYIAEHYISPYFRITTHSNYNYTSFGDTIRNKEYCIKFLEYHYSQPDKIFTFKYINPSFELIEFVKYATDLNGYTDLINAFMIIQAIFQSHAYKVGISKFKYVVKQFKKTHIGTNPDLYSFKLMNIISYKELLNLLETVQAF